MAAFTSGDKTLAAHQGKTHPALDVGTPVEVDTFLAGKWYLWHANTEIDANVDGVSYFLQGSRLTSGNLDWVTIAKIKTGKIAAALASIAGAEGIGSKVLDVGSAEEVPFAAEELVYVRDVGTENLSEWHHVHDVLTADTIKIWDGLTAAKTSSDKIISQAEDRILHVDLSGIFRIRMVTSHQGGSGSNIAFKSFLRNAEKIEVQ